MKTRQDLGKPVGGAVSEKRSGGYGSTRSGGRCAPARSSTRSSSIWSAIWAAMPWKTAFMSSWRALSWHELTHGRGGLQLGDRGAARPGHQGRGAGPLAPGHRGYATAPCPPSHRSTGRPTGPAWHTARGMMGMERDVRSGASMAKRVHRPREDTEFDFILGMSAVPVLALPVKGTEIATTVWRNRTASPYWWTTATSSLTGSAVVPSRSRTRGSTRNSCSSSSQMSLSAEGRRASSFHRGDCVGDLGEFVCQRAREVAAAERASPWVMPPV